MQGKKTILASVSIADGGPTDFVSFFLFFSFYVRSTVKPAYVATCIKRLQKEANMKMAKLLSLKKITHLTDINKIKCLPLQLRAGR